MRRYRIILRDSIYLVLENGKIINSFENYEAAILFTNRKRGWI